MEKLLASLGLRQRITIVAVVLLAAGGLFALLRWRREADFRPLFTEMAAEDAGAVVQKLKEAGVPYRLSETGGTVMVPSDRIAEWRLGMAAAGLPKSGRIGKLEPSVMPRAEVEQARLHLVKIRPGARLEPESISVLDRRGSVPELSPGPIQIKEVEAVQRQSIAMVRQLESGGTVNLNGTVGEQYVV